jgi:hypothetical protein
LPTSLPTRSDGHSPQRPFGGLANSNTDSDCRRHLVSATARSPPTRVRDLEFGSLLDAALPSTADSDLVTVRVDEAKKILRSRASTKTERRQAVRELADVLEVLRPEIKLEMLSKDESDLFHLANGFAIRHNSREQRRDYDDAIWLSWAFYVYLATIHAVLRLRERENVA